MKQIRPLVVLAAAAALSSCGTVGRAADAIWPFNDGGPRERAPEEGRISILSSEQDLAVDPQLATRSIMVPAPTPSSDWAQPGGVASNAPINVQGPSALTVADRRDLGAGSNNTVRIAAPPVIANGRLFFIDADHEVHAYDVEGGRRQWSRRLRPEDSRDRRARGGGVATDGARVYVTTGFAFMAALDAATGEEIWRRRTNAPFQSAPTVAGGRVYAVTNDSELVAVDAATGELQWSHQAIAEPARIMSASSPAVSGDTVIAPFASGEVVALLGANGRRLWGDSLTRAGGLNSLSAINDVAGRPAVDGGVMYAASHSGVLAAIDMRSGQRIWARNFASTQTPWIAGETLYAVTVDGELAALDRQTGGVYWLRQLRRFRDEDDRRGRVAWTGPVMVGGRLILANSLGEVAAVNPANGEVVETRDIGGEIFIPPIAANGAIYIVNDDARLTILR